MQQQELSIVTWDDLFKANDANLISIQKDLGAQGRVFIELSILAELKKICSFFSVKYDANAGQLETVCELLSETYCYNRLSDFRFFAKEVIKGNIGQVDYTLDGAKFVELYKRFEYVKSEKRESMHKDSKQANDFTLKMEIVERLAKEGKNISELKTDISKAIFAEHKAKSQESFIDKNIQKLIKEFDEEHNKQLSSMPEHLKKGTRFIKHKNNYIDVTTYIYDRLDDIKKANDTLDIPMINDKDNLTN